MSYSSSPIGAVITDVNVKYFLPAIQRPYVWSSDQIVALFDSLPKACPISNFMFWGVDESTKHEVRSYKFLENYRPGALNEVVSVDGRNVVLVLDGQQRLPGWIRSLWSTRSVTKANWPRAMCCGRRAASGLS